MHLAECFGIQESLRTRKCQQMIEFIIYLYRNLFKIPDINPKDGSIAYRRELQPKFILTLAKHSTFDAFIFIIQQSSDVLLKKIGFILLEIFYYLFSPFEPAWLFQQTEQDKTFIQAIRDREKKERMVRLSEMSSRHARFDCNIKIVRGLGTSAKIIHNPFKSDWDKTEIDVPNSLKKPKRRKFDPKNTTIFPSSQNKELIVSNILEQENINGSLKQIIRHLAVDFVEHVYDPLVEKLYEEIHKGTRTILPEDRIYFFVITGFGLEIFRYNFYFKKANRDASIQPSNDEYSIAVIGAALQITIFEHIQAAILKEANATNLKYFNVRVFHAALYSFLQLLYCLKEMKFSLSESARKNAQILTQKIVSQDNARMLRSAFSRYAPEVHDPKLGKTLAELVGTFFELLDDYSKGKVIKIQTGQRIRPEKIREKKEKEKEKQRQKQQREKEREKKRKKKARMEKRKRKEKKRERKRAKEHKHKLRAKDIGKENVDEDREKEEKYIDEDNMPTDAQKDPTTDKQNEFLETDGVPTLEIEAPSILETVNETQPTEYTVGPTLESDLYSTLDQAGPTMETLPTLDVVQTLDSEIEDSLIQENNENKETQLFEPTLEIQAGNEEESEEVSTKEKEPEERNKRKVVKRTSSRTDAEVGSDHLEKENDKIPEEDKAEEDEDRIDVPDQLLEGEEEEEAEDHDDDEDEEESDTERLVKAKPLNEDEDEDKDENEDDEEEEEEEEGPSEIDDEDSDLEDNLPEFRERIVNFASELAYLADYRVLDILLNMIRIDKLEKNDQKLNNSITGFIKKIVNVLKADWLFFQVDYLLIFQDILNTKNPRV